MRRFCGIVWQSTPVLALVVVVVVVVQGLGSTGLWATADCPWSKAPRRTATHAVFIVNVGIASRLSI
jgi:hypothetical protein